jgi:glycosyltransferase involved in cell wall biosynthesis
VRFFSGILTRKLVGELEPRPDLPWVLVVAHDASRTGAPIVAFNLAAELSPRFNVVVVSLTGGPLLEAFRKVSVEVRTIRRLGPKPLRAGRAVRAALQGRRFAFAVLNSLETHSAALPLAASATKIVTLVHEFAASQQNHDQIRKLYDLSGAIVFSSILTREDSERRIGFPPSAQVILLPQGKCVIPSRTAAEAASATTPMTDLLRPPRHENDFLVLGAGSIDYRKGVDLFLSLAALARAAAPDIPFRFVWIGGRLDAKASDRYLMFLADQLERSGVQDIVSILPSTPDIETAYRLADVLMLPSRLDPLPNVAIDALSVGLPVLSFDKATGVAELQHSVGLGESCVAPYLDLAAMTQRLVDLARSTERHQSVRDQSARLAQDRLDMGKYVASLVQLASTLPDRNGTDRDGNLDKGAT